MDSLSPVFAKLKRIDCSLKRSRLSFSVLAALAASAPVSVQSSVFPSEFDLASIDFDTGWVLKEPLNNYARSAFQSEKPQIVWCDTSDSSHRYGREARRARCGFSGETQ